MPSLYLQPTHHFTCNPHFTVLATDTSLYLQPNLELLHDLTLDYQRLLYMILDVLLELDAYLQPINDGRETVQAK